MKENESALYSQYIIDGIRCSATPAELLEECMNYDEPQDMPAHTFDDIIDEATEPPLSARTYDMDNWQEYISRITPPGECRQTVQDALPRPFHPPSDSKGTAQQTVERRTLQTWRPQDMGPVGVEHKTYRKHERFL